VSDERDVPPGAAVRAGGKPEPGARPEAGAEAGREPEAGPELARAVLDAARARRRATGKPQRRTIAAATDEPATGEPGTGEPAVEGLPGQSGQPGRTGQFGRTGQSRGRDRQPGGRRLRGYSGPGPDPRDPQRIGAVLAKLVKARGWQRPAAEATVFGAWTRVVGPDVAEHSRPVRLEEGVLTVEAESTAWATQLRLLAPRLLGRIAAQVGQGVVRQLHIHGPATPDWSKGPRRVRGRGPRDTYG
jgi:predicted nucleic acid-binding Zn ribbon protein